jgi:hypothetical protein
VPAESMLPVAAPRAGRVCRQAAAVTLVLVLILPGSALAAVMFKYRNAEGDVVYSYTLPPGQAPLGYDRVDLGTGKVIESVAPQLPPAELEARQRREKALAECRSELRRIYAMYGSENDIVAAERASVEALERRIGQIQVNLTRTRQELDRLRGQAAEMERSGSQVSGTLIDRISRNEVQAVQLESEIAQRRDEQDQARERYRHEMERFRDGRCPAPEAVARGGGD